MRFLWPASCVLHLVFLVPACSSEAVDGSDGTPQQEEGSNPLLEDQSNRGEQDTAHINPDGIEVEVDVEGDTGASGHQLRKSPAHISQFATTYLLRRGKFYLESLTEQATSASRAEWLVDGTWLTAEQANMVDPAKLKRWRVKAVSAVLLGAQSRDVNEGAVFAAKTPINPFSVMEDAGDTCADPNSHISLSSSVYWYVWNPDRADCSIPTQELTVTVSRMAPKSHNVHPEYGRIATCAAGRPKGNHRVHGKHRIGGSPSADPGSGSAGLGSASAGSAAPVVPFRATAQVARS
ncbi:MAG: hypothetical protein MUF54_16465 [Polyangiaceae bacterium]|jgi:hypothetical protein|nr:hypothetical protein [Polyangiaceae bacterium]